MRRTTGAYEVPRPAAKIAAIVLGLLIMLAQQGPVHAQSDTTIYDRIEQFSDKHKFFHWLHSTVFVRSSKPAPVAEADQPRRGRDPNERLRGRVIRKIDIRVFDPFGNDLDDTTSLPSNGLERLGNRVHVRTRDFLVEHLLLFKEGDRLDPLRLSESERVLRSSPMVNDARVRAISVKNARDSVDVVVLVQDQWTLEAGLSGDATSAEGRLAENNILGFGQAYEQRVSYVLDDPEPSWSGQHRIYNIDDTFISSTMGYSLAPLEDRVYLSLDRGFYSPLARWAGGIYVGHAWSHPSPDTTDGTDRLTLSANRYDLDTWAGISLRTGKEEVPSVQASSLVLAGRYATSWYNNRLRIPLSDSIYTETRLGLASVSLSVRQYVKDRYLYRFGLTEDVAEGLLLTATSGGRWGPVRSFEPYLSFAVTRARYFGNAGYVSLHAGVGGFMPGDKVKDGLMLFEGRYFTPAFDVGTWKLRQFAQLIFAKALEPSTPDGIDLNGQQLLGFEPDVWLGDWKTTLKTETVIYLPYELIGFRFAPVFVFALGTLGSEHETLFTNTLQPAFGLGLLIRNEHLLTETFQISVAFYPPILPNSPEPFRWDALDSFSLRNPDLAPSRPDLLYVPR